LGVNFAASLYFTLLFLGDRFDIDCVRHQPFAASQLRLGKPTTHPSCEASKAAAPTSLRSFAASAWQASNKSIVRSLEGCRAEASAKAG